MAEAHEFLVQHWMVDWVLGSRTFSGQSILDYDKHPDWSVAGKTQSWIARWDRPTYFCSGGCHLQHHWQGCPLSFELEWHTMLSVALYGCSPPPLLVSQNMSPPSASPLHRSPLATQPAQWLGAMHCSLLHAWLDLLWSQPALVEAALSSIPRRHLVHSASPAMCHWLSAAASVAGSM